MAIGPLGPKFEVGDTFHALRDLGQFIYRDRDFRASVPCCRQFKILGNVDFIF